MSNNPFDEKQSNIRPTLLTVLCILTFIWNAYKFYGSIENAFMPDKVIANKEQANEMTTEMLSKYVAGEDADKIEAMQAEMTSKLFDRNNIVTSGFLSLVSAILLIVGAVFMWGLQKRGFWIYLAGNLIGILAPIVIFGGQIGWTVAICSLCASALFSLLYYTNLKYMA